MRAFLLAMVAVVAQGAPREPVAADPALPWLFNVDVTAVASSDDPSVSLPLDLLGATDPSCEDAPTAGLRLVGDVARAPGKETVVGSYAHGLMVFGSEGGLLAHTPGYPCNGSADDIDVLAAGTVFGEPMVFAAITTGGRREQLTWIAMYRVGFAGRLEPVFAGAVEQREDGIIRRGSVTVLPGALLVRDPDGGQGFWAWDASAGVYVPYGGYGDRTPHS